MFHHSLATKISQCTVVYTNNPTNHGNFVLHLYMDICEVKDFWHNFTNNCSKLVSNINYADYLTNFQIVHFINVIFYNFVEFWVIKNYQSNFYCCVICVRNVDQDDPLDFHKFNLYVQIKLNDSPTILNYLVLYLLLPNWFAVKVN